MGLSPNTPHLRGSPAFKKYFINELRDQIFRKFFHPAILKTKRRKAGLREYGYISVPQFVYSFKKSGIEKIYKNLEFYTPQMRGIRRQTQHRIIICSVA